MYVMKNRILITLGLSAAVLLSPGCGGKDTASDETAYEEQETVVTTVSRADHMANEAKLKGKELLLRTKEESLAVSKNLRENQPN